EKGHEWKISLFCQVERLAFEIQLMDSLQTFKET
ncbi:MAG: hypothetical protein FD143_3418, partial [Ignavibacteria bacterium]